MDKFQSLSGSGGGGTFHDSTDNKAPGIKINYIRAYVMY